MWETTDPDGRRVVLSEERWLHIVEIHAELEVVPESVVVAVAMPDRRHPGRDPGEEWFYAAGIGPSRWMKVVVHYERQLGRIATAFPPRSFP